jgi:hypothetical protein
VVGRLLGFRPRDLGQLIRGYVRKAMDADLPEVCVSVCVTTATTEFLYYAQLNQLTLIHKHYSSVWKELANRGGKGKYCITSYRPNNRREAGHAKINACK